MRYVLPITLTLGLFSGCSGATGAGASFNSETGMTTYESSRIALGRASSAQLTGGDSIVLEAEAECFGEGCRPESYLIKLVNPTANEISSEFNQVVFTTPQGTVSFEPGQTMNGQTIVFNRSGRGELVRLSIPRDIFTSFATAQPFTIRLGSSIYTVPYERRGSLRAMIPGLETDA